MYSFPVRLLVGCVAVLLALWALEVAIDVLFRIALPLGFVVLGLGTVWYLRHRYSRW